MAVHALKMDTGGEASNDEEEPAPGKVTLALSDLDGAISKSRQTLVCVDAIAARAQRLAKRRRNTPARLFEAVRGSVPPPKE